MVGTFNKVLLDCGEGEINVKTEKKFKPSKATITPATDSVVAYIKLRGITPETVRALSIDDLS